MDISHLLTGILGTLIGVMIGHRLAIERYRRIEFNKAAGPLFELLERQRFIVEAGSFPASANDVKKMTLIAIRRKLPFYERKGFDRAIEKYRLATQHSGEYEKGSYKFNNPEILLTAINGLQKFLPYK